MEACITPCASIACARTLAVDQRYKAILSVDEILIGETGEGTHEDVEWRAKEISDNEELREVVEWNSEETPEREELVKGGELAIRWDIGRRMEKE